MRFFLVTNAAICNVVHLANMFKEGNVLWLKALN